MKNCSGGGSSGSGSGSGKVAQSGNKTGQAWDGHTVQDTVQESRLKGLTLGGNDEMSEVGSDGSESGMGGEEDGEWLDAINSGRYQLLPSLVIPARCNSVLT